MTKNTIRTAALALALIAPVALTVTPADAAQKVALHGYYQKVPNITPPTRLDIAMPGNWSRARQVATCQDMGGKVGPELPGRHFGLRCVGVDY